MDDVLRMKLKDILTLEEVGKIALNPPDFMRFDILLTTYLYSINLEQLDYLCRTLFVPGECIADNVTIAVDLLLSRAEVHLNDLALIKNEGAG
jgi:hypothetical protein